MTTETEKKTKSNNVPRDIFNLFIGRCRHPVDGSLLGQEVVLEAMEMGILEAYNQGFMDGYEKRDIEVREEK